MIEFHVRLAGVAVDALPCQIQPLFRHRRDLLDAGFVGGNSRVTDQTGIDARKAGLRSLGDAFMAVLETGQPFLDVDVVRKLDGLLRFGLHPEEVVDRGA